MKIFQIACTAIVAASVISGCSSSDSVTDSGFEADVRAAPLAAQSVTISIADPDGIPVATVTSQSADMSTAATATSTGATSLDLDIVLTNNAGRILFNPKLVHDAANAANDLGTAVLAGSGAYPSTGDQYLALGTKAVDHTGGTSVATESDTLDINTIDAVTDPMVLVFTIPTQDISLYTTDGTSTSVIEQIDTGAQVQTEILNDVSLRFRGNNSGFRDGVSSPDGRYVFMGHKQQPVIAILNTVTHGIDSIQLLENAGVFGATHAVTMSPNTQYLYATVVEGAHMYAYGTSGLSSDNAGGIKNYLVKVDRESMTVVSRLDLTEGMAGARLRKLTISDDGNTGVVGVGWGGHVAVVDLSGDMSLTQMVNVTATGGGRPRFAVISGDASKAYVAYNPEDTPPSPDGNLDVIDLSDYSITQIMPTTATGTTYAADLQIGPDGRLYYARMNTQFLTTFDISGAPVETEIANVDTVSRMRSQIAFNPYGGVYYYLNTGSDLQVFDITDDSLSDSFAVGTGGYHMNIPSTY